MGISTGGAAEIRMAMRHPRRHIVVTTLDSIGAEFAQDQISEKGLSEQIEVKIENVAEALPYVDGYFDYIYARLVLHYLPKADLQCAVRELHRTLRLTNHSLTGCAPECKIEAILASPHLTPLRKNGKNLSILLEAPPS